MKILIKNISLLASPQGKGEWLELKEACLLSQDNQIAFVGTQAEFETWQKNHALVIDKTIDASGCVVLPGFVNCHHHLYQSLTRGVATAKGMILFDWLKFLYPIWGQLTPNAIYISAKLALAELVLSGCTTVADHLYMFPNGSTLDDEIAAAREVGVRFHPTRGSMSLGESQGGLPPDYLIEQEEAILKDSVRVVERFHDAERFSMLRVGLAPCSPFSVTSTLMQASAELARSYKLVNLHTHLAETQDENQFCLDLFGKRPLDYVASLGWEGEDVWFAHMVHPNENEIKQLAHSCSGVCHCASSNMILASGIAPVKEMLDAGVRLGLGVDGSASNDSNHMLAEVRQAMLLQRVGWPSNATRADRFNAREALELATLGGAKTLGRDDIGLLEVGMAADFVAFRVDDLAHAGGLGDPLGSLVTCQPTNVWLSVINGKIVVEDGVFKPFDLQAVIKEHNRVSLALIS